MTQVTPAIRSPSPSMAAGTTSTSSPSLVDSLFQRSLDDLIRALRSCPSAAAEGAAIARARALDEIRREIRSQDLDTKAVALQKLTYLASLHSLDLSWAAFHALELLPSPSLPHARAGYLAASLSFHPSSTDLLPLVTHQLRKHLAPSPYNSPALVAPALHLLALASSPDLACHLAPDLLPLLSSQAASSPLRPKAIAAALRALAVCPDAAPVLFKPLVDSLSISDPRTAAAAISAFCELALAAPDPSPYLPLAPEFYRLLVDSRNNWVLIKVLKIFARLAPLEPRLAIRIIDPICQLLGRSHAKSLVFECIRTILTSLSDHDDAVRLAIDKAKEFLASDDDPNLRYLGLRALTMVGPTQSWAVDESRETVIRSLHDSDTNIRHEALCLIMRMLCESNVVEICNLLIKYAMKSEPEFANEILDAVLMTCDRNVYELISDFDWYVTLLGEMARNPHCAKGAEIERQLVDIGLRVRDARPELVSVARDLLIDPALLGNPFLCRVLSAAAWVSGEYAEFSRNPLELVEALLQPRTNLLPSLVRAIYIQAVFKVTVFSFISSVEQMRAVEFVPAGDQEGSGFLTSETSTDQNPAFESDNGIAASDKVVISDTIEKKETFTHEYISRLLNFIETAVGPLSECDEVEVQERARNVLGLIFSIRETQFCNIKADHHLTRDTKIGEIVELMEAAFSEELGPVSANAQKRVSLPEGLTLSENLSDLAEILGDKDTTPCASISFSSRSHHHHHHSVETNEDSEPAIETTSLLTEHRKRHGLYYLPTEKDNIESNDYPRANDPPLPVNHGDTTEDILKFTAESLVPRKAKPTKQRPVVIRLDEGDGVSSSNLTSAKESKEDLLSGAVRDVLLGKESKPSSLLKNSPDKTSRRRVNDTTKNSEAIPRRNESNTLGDNEPGASSSRKSRHHNRHKERNESSGRNDDSEKSHRHSTKSSHHHGRHKRRQRGDATSGIIPQAPVIQDFLL